jgi:hypothetical protein
MSTTRLLRNSLTAFVKAVDFAAGKHRFQRRKDEDASPYINHPIAVANVLATGAGISDPVTLCAAVLHDTIEDTETTAGELEETFGAQIGSALPVGSLLEIAWSRVSRLMPAFCAAWGHPCVPGGVASNWTRDLQTIPGIDTPVMMSRRMQHPSGTPVAMPSATNHQSPVRRAPALSLPKGSACSGQAFHFSPVTFHRSLPPLGCPHHDLAPKPRIAGPLDKFFRTPVRPNI